MINKLVNKLVPGFRKIDRILNKAELVCAKTDRSKYDFKRFAFSVEFIEKIYNHEITLNEAINDQTELKILINKLNNEYNKKKKTDKITEENKVLESARKLSNARDDIIDLFKEETFPFKDNASKIKEKELEEKNFFEYIEDESKKDISYKLFKKHFYYLAHIVLAKDKNQNNKLVNVIESELIDLKKRKRKSKNQIK